MQLVLSLFPGIGLLDMAFEQEGFCVVRGPDVLWGGDIRRFHPPAGKFDGVIGGPPCQRFSELRHMVAKNGHRVAENLIPEYCRCVAAARPDWFIMENVRHAESPIVDGYKARRSTVIDWKCGGRTRRKRAIWFGTRDGRPLRVRQDQWPSGKIERAVTSNVRIPAARHFAAARAKGGGVMPGDGAYATIEEVCRRQSLPDDWTATMPFKIEAIRKMLGNGVPLPMGRAIAKAVKEATEQRTQAAAANH